MLALLDTPLSLFHFFLPLSFISSPPILSFSGNMRAHIYSCAHASRVAIYAYVHLCTKRSAHTCRARNISRVRIELCHPSFSLFSRSSFPIRERGTRVSRQIDLPPGNGCCTRCEQTRTSKRFEDRVIFTPVNYSFSFTVPLVNTFVRGREREREREKRKEPRQRGSMND